MKLGPHGVTLRQLQYLVAVADRRSFRRAAEACHVSQPALSAQLAQAEETLSVQVFERDRRKVLLTPAGEAVIQQARRVLLAADELEEQAARWGDPLRGTLRLGVIPTVGPYLLPDVVPALREQFPQLRQVWREDKTAHLLRDLERGELDAAILALEADIGDVAYVELAKDPFLFAAPLEHPLAAASGPIEPRELGGQPVLLLDDGHCFRDQALDLCTHVGASEQGLRATSLPTLTQMVVAGLGVTVLPQLAAEVENRRGTLRLREFRGAAPGRTLVLAWRRHAAFAAALTELGQSLRDLLARRPAASRAGAKSAKRTKGAAERGATARGQGKRPRGAPRQRSS